MCLTYHETAESFNEFLTKSDLGKSSDSLGLTRDDFQKYWCPSLPKKLGGMEKSSDYFLCPSAFARKPTIPESRIVFRGLPSFDLFAVLDVCPVSSWMEMGVEAIVGGAQVFGDNSSSPRLAGLLENSFPVSCQSNRPL